MDTVGLRDYPNVPQSLGTAMRYVPLRDLDEYYSLEDMYDVLEVHAVDAYNTKKVEKLTRKGAK